MRAIGRSTQPLTVAICAIVAVALAGRTADAIEVWMPETGEVHLDELARESPESRFKHAAALIGAGQPVSGAAELRKLVAEHPEAEWVEQARYLIAFGLFRADRFKKAFVEWENFLALYPDSELKDDVHEMQLQATRSRTKENEGDGLALYDRLISRAPSWEFAALCQKEKADAALDAEDYLLARDEYLALIDYYPDSTWAPYCWYKIAECDFKLAAWVRRGTEHWDRVRAELDDFVRIFPEHKLVKEARQKLERVQAQQAAKYREIAEYYLGPARRPTAALPYLGFLVTEFPDTGEATWAEQKLTQIHADQTVPVKGGYKKLALPGVSSARHKGTATP